MITSILLLEETDNLRMVLIDPAEKKYPSDFPAATGEGWLPKAVRSKTRLTIIDLMSRNTGQQMCRDLRKSGCLAPILILTNRSLTIDKVIGSDQSADHDLQTAYEATALLAHIQTLLLRASLPNAIGLLDFDDVTIDLGGTKVARDGRPVRLSAREFRLLECLVQHAGHTLSRTDLLREVWGHDDDKLTRTVDVHIAKLRQKLERNPKEPKLLLTVPGFGYRWIAAKRC